MFVPVPVERLRAALSDPERVARAVPGLQQDAGTAPVAGRLKVRVAGHTITYRGALHVTVQDDGSYAIEGDATEARGSGVVKLTLSVRLRSAEGGTAVTFSGTATADGRIAELPSEAVGSTTTRMLSRFAERLGEGEGAGASAGAESEGASEVEGASAAVPGTESASEGGADADADADAAAASEADAEPGKTGGAEAESGPTPVFGAEVPQPEALESYAEDEPGGEDFIEEGEPPAEAAHARRTMIGRSAEEVDHAPPRGRYAPVPAPESVMPGSTLRWAAPAAALAVASAVLVARALRKRR
ncbi:SRPBCC domain-containing protein [Streptomyces phyllanthi]